MKIAYDQFKLKFSALTQIILKYSWLNIILDKL